MGLLSAMESQFINLRMFRAFFPPLQTLHDGFVFATQRLRDGRARRYPSVLDVTVTNRCNQTCTFCCNATNTTGPAGELTTAQMLALIEDGARHRAGVFLGGGEPLVRPDIWTLIRRIKQERLPLGMATNGLLLDEALADEILSAGVDAIMVSIHGTESVHDALVGVPGAWRRSMAALKALADRMPSPGPLVNYVLTPQSAVDLPRFLDEVRGLQNIVVRLSHQSFLTQEEYREHEREWERRVGGTCPGVLTPIVDRIPDVAAIVEKALDDRKTGRLVAKPALSAKELKAWYSPGFRIPRRCLFVWFSAFLNPDGATFPCQYYPHVLGTVRNEPVAAIWNNPRSRHFRKVLQDGLLPGCMRCCKL